MVHSPSSTGVQSCRGKSIERFAGLANIWKIDELEIHKILSDNPNILPNTCLSLPMIEIGIEEISLESFQCAKNNPRVRGCILDLEVTNDRQTNQQRP